MTSNAHHYELLTPCTCGDATCTSRDVTSIDIEPAHPYVGGIPAVFIVRFDQDEIWSRRIVQYADDERTAVRHAVTRVFGEDAFRAGAVLV